MIKTSGCLQLTVSGNSMFPTLREGDQIDIVPQKEYCIGDILVFIYKDNSIVAHRLLKQNEKLYCKGDNSFLLEHVNRTNVLGKVIGLYRAGKYSIPVKFDNEMISLSYRISKEFRICGYDKNIISQKTIYIDYKNKLDILCL